MTTQTTTDIYMLFDAVDNSNHSLLFSQAIYDAPSSIVPQSMKDYAEEIRMKHLKKVSELSSALSELGFKNIPEGRKHFYRRTAD